VDTNGYSVSPQTIRTCNWPITKLEASFYAYVYAAIFTQQNKTEVTEDL